MGIKRRKFIEALGLGPLALLTGCGGGSDSGAAIGLQKLAPRGFCTSSATVAPANAPNILLISVDDLNDWVGCLGGHPQALTPNIDRLAAEGVLFTNAHSPAPSCRPSRTSVLTGYQPFETGVYTTGRELGSFRSRFPDLVTLPQYFKQNGYYTAGGGKVFHNPDPDSWDDYYPDDNTYFFGNPRPAFKPLNGIADLGNLDWGAVSDTVEEMSDYRYVSEWLRPALQQTYDKPFFMGIGFTKPHLPWFVPAEFFDAFDPDSVVLPEIVAGDRADLPPQPLHWFEVAMSLGVPTKDNHNDIVAAGKWNEGVAGYLTAVYFADYVVGQALDALENSAYADNTIVVLWSDQGFHLGEKEYWRKNTLWHESTRVPFIICDKRSSGLGTEVDQVVSLIDMYPTLAEMCGLPVCMGLSGESLVPLMQNPGLEATRPAICTRSRGNHAVITNDWRYIRYNDNRKELYDLANDPGEWGNLADNVAYADVASELDAWLPMVQAEADHLG